jgi:hypothetical protein
MTMICFVIRNEHMGKEQHMELKSALTRRRKLKPLKPLYFSAESTAIKRAVATRSAMK